jgi:MFS family permease
MDASSYVYSSEIFPTSIRAQGAGFSVSGLFVFSLIYTMCAPTAFNNIGWRYYLIFIIVPLIGAAIMYFFYPETKGLALEEIGAKFGDEVAVDLTHLSPEERARLDKTLAHGDVVQMEHKEAA